jgi:hypothetical protein
MSNRFSTGKIYAIKCRTTGHVYYGSTVNTLSYRLSMHKREYRKYLNGKYPYTTSFQILEKDNYFIELVENYPCESFQQLLSRESHYINSFACVNRLGKHNNTTFQCERCLLYTTPRKENLRRHLQKQKDCYCGSDRPTRDELVLGLSKCSLTKVEKDNLTESLYYPLDS